MAPTSFEGNSAGCGWDWEVGGGIGRLVVGLGGWGWDWEVWGGIPEVGGGKVPPPPAPQPRNPTTQQHMASHFIWFFAGF